MNENTKNESVNSQYQRDNYDDPRQRAEFKKEVFKGKQTLTDDYSGKQIHFHSKAAKSKYGYKKYSEHSSDTDHIIPLKKIHKKNKNNPFLTDDDIKEIANVKENFKITNSHFNRQKGDKDNIRISFDFKNYLPVKSRAKLIRDHFVASGHTMIKATELTAKNATSEFSYGAKTSLNNASVPLIINTVNNLCAVACGEKEFDEAALEFGIVTTQTMAYGGVNQIVNKVAHNALSKIMSSNTISQVVFVASLIGSTGVKLINGEISGAEFFQEIGEKGVTLISGVIGSIAGQLLIPIPIVGTLIGSVIVTYVCSAIIQGTQLAISSIKQGFKTVNRDARKLAKINALTDEALKEIQKQREILKEMMETQFKQWDASFEKGFDLIINGSMNENADTVASGIDNILQVFEKNVKFATLQDFNDFFMNEDAILKI